MKICVLGDTHFGVRNDNNVFHDYFSRFYINVLIPYLEKNNIDTIIQLGDVFDRRKYINFNSLYQCREYFFDIINQKNIKFHTLLGNHDCFFKNHNNVNSPSLLLKEYDNITIHTGPGIVEFDGLNIAFLPWVCPSNYNQSMDFIENAQAPILFGHLELIGFEMYRGTFNDHGLDMNIFNRYDVVCSGHFHHKSSRGNIHYLGSPYEMTWSDYNDTRGFHIFDTETRDLTYIQNPYKIFHKIHYDDVDKTLDEILSIDTDLYQGGYVKIIVRNKTNPYWLDLLVEKLEKTNIADLQVVEDHFKLNLEDESDILEDVEDTMTILNNVVDGIDTSVDKKSLLNFLSGLYQEALYV